MKMDAPLTLSVIVVNYQTRDELQACLDSIFGSEQGVSYEVWVVDNNSADGSARMVKEKFPQVRLVENNENLGFAKASNQAMRKSASEFVLLLNPDTIVFDHVFDKAIDFLRETPDAGMVSCKLVKEDGKLDLACRRSFPSAFDGACRAIGLSKLFPRSRLLARYNLTFLDEDRCSQVDAVNGAFMMVRKSAIDEVGMLDEDYFMYMEDMDWCYRFRKKGWKVCYVPGGKVVHLKGQSGRKNSNPMIHEFFRSMELFCRKNYRPHQTRAGYWATLAGIKAWKNMTLLRNSLRKAKRVTP